MHSLNNISMVHGALLSKLWSIFGYNLQKGVHCPKSISKFKLRKETQSHTHLRIQKTNNNQVKVRVNTLCMLGLCAKCGIKIVSWGFLWIYVEPDAFEICTHATGNYAPCKGTKFTTILVTNYVCHLPLLFLTTFNQSMVT